MKTCSTCRQQKPLDDFHRDRHARDGRARLCKLCACAKSARWVKENPDKARETRKRWGRTNRDAVNRRARARYEADPTRDLDAKRKYRYGIDRATYDAMLAAQHGRCAICGGPPGRSRLHVDHDHITGAVRGLLCGPCNQGLGFLRDDPDVLRAALRYLEAHATV